MTATQSDFLASTGLTQREVEVLGLISEGRSNRMIADEFVISISTVERHVNHIYSKTGCSNRVEASTYATRHGLASGVDAPEA